MSRKPQVKRSAEEKWEIIQEGIKSGNVAETCRRYGIAPNLYYRWKDEAEQGAKSLCVKKCVPNCTSPTTTTVYVFSGSKVIAEYVNGASVTSPTREYIYSGSALVATHESSTLKFHYPDHLSTRVTSDSAGANRTEQAHYPFGEQWYNSSGAKLLFTSYERDSESGNDYAMFRTHISRLGRFNRPDPVAGSIADPQSLNRYTYVQNDPVNLVDPLGLLKAAIEFKVKFVDVPRPGTGLTSGDLDMFGNEFGLWQGGAGARGNEPPDIPIPTPDFGPPPPFVFPQPRGPLPEYCDPRFIEHANRAWNDSVRGAREPFGREQAFVARGSSQALTFVDLPDIGTHRSYPFVPQVNDVYNFHTHPDDGDPRPLGPDQTVSRPNPPGTLIRSYVGSSRGLYVTDPTADEGYRRVREGLSWLGFCI